MTTLLHELRCFPGGELGNRAADEIERLQREIAALKSAAFTLERTHRAAVAYGSLGWTIETVSQWLETQGLTAVSKADAERINAAAGYVLMPRTLTAENGAKAALIGEFHAVTVMGCPDCFDDSAEDAAECETCEGTGLVDHKITIDWDTTKRIYAAAVDACALEQKQ